MKINLKEVKSYFLTVNKNVLRKKHMLQEFNDCDLTEVNPVYMGTGKEIKKSGATGFTRMLDLGLRNQDRSMPFQPFIMYEDDCSKFREYPECIEVPDDADILYVGLSMRSMDNKKDHSANYYKIVNDDTVRIYNMLSTHGIMVCSASGALAIQKAVIETYYKCMPYDICLAYLQPYYNVYALKSPLVYQDSTYGGAEKLTKFSITSNSDNPIPIEYINRTNDSVIMGHRV